MAIYRARMLSFAYNWKLPAYGRWSFFAYSCVLGAFLLAIVAFLLAVGASLLAIEAFLLTMGSASNKHPNQL